MTDAEYAGASSRVVQTLRRQGPLSRVELSGATGLAKSTITRVVQGLLDRDTLVEHGAQHSSRPGRPRIVVSLNPALGQWIGLDFGLRNVRAALVDVAHHVNATAEVEVGRDYDLEEGLTAAVTVAERVMETVGDSLRVVGIGAAVPGPVDPASGEVAWTSTIPRWAGHKVAARLSDRFGREVVVENDSNCAALAEHMWGAARGCQDVAYFKLHSGVGGGLLVAGHLIRGFRGAAGEFGHVSLAADGPICRCGGRGCLEAYASVPAVLGQMTMLGPQAASLATLRDAVKAQHSGALRALEEAGRMAGLAAASTFNTVGSQRIIFGGVLSEFGDLVLTPARQAFTRQSLTCHTLEDASTIIHAGELGRLASTLGAVAAAMAASDSPGVDKHGTVG